MLIPSIVNFKIILGQPSEHIVELFDDVGPYDLDSMDFEFQLFLGDPENPVIVEIEEIPDSNTLKVIFKPGDVPELGEFEYILFGEIPNDGYKQQIIKGTISSVQYVPFSDTIEQYLSSELPLGVKLTPTFMGQRVRFWRLYLQHAFGLSDEQVHIENLWPELANALIAKLVFHDALLLAIRGNMFGFFGGDYTQEGSGGGSVKKIETGPSSVEFHPLGNTLNSLLGKGSSGYSVWDELLTTLCGLARKLGVKIPMCKGNKHVQAPKYYTNPKWAYPKLNEEFPPSRG